jgi:hypothetical protein
VQQQRQKQEHEVEDVERDAEAGTGVRAPERRQAKEAHHQVQRVTLLDRPSEGAAGPSIAMVRMGTGGRVRGGNPRRSGQEIVAGANALGPGVEAQHGQGHNGHDDRREGQIERRKRGHR